MHAFPFDRAATSRLTFLVPTLVLALCLAALPGPAAAQAQGKKALLIVAKENFEQTEYARTREALEGAGVAVTVASTKTGTLKGNKSKRIQSDLELANAAAADYDAVVVIGGGGVMDIWKNEDAHRVLREAAAGGKILGGICAGPGVLAYAGVLDGKRATAHPRSGVRELMERRGGTYTGAKVEIDGKLVTANGPDAAEAFGQTLVKALGQ